MMTTANCVLGSRSCCALTYPPCTALCVFSEFLWLHFGCARCCELALAVPWARALGPPSAAYVAMVLTSSYTQAGYSPSIFSDLIPSNFLYIVVFGPPCKGWLDSCVVTLCTRFVTSR